MGWFQPLANGQNKFMAEVLINIEVAYARCEQQFILSLKIVPGSCVEEAITLSGLLTRFIEIDLKVAKVGIFGKLCSLDKVLREGDRVEIYRPLICAPKQARRSRAR